MYNGCVEDTDWTHIIVIMEVHSKNRVCIAYVLRLHYVCKGVRRMPSATKILSSSKILGKEKLASADNCKCVRMFSEYKPNCVHKSYATRSECQWDHVLASDLRIICECITNHSQYVLSVSLIHALYICNCSLYIRNVRKTFNNIYHLKPLSVSIRNCIRIYSW